MKATGKSFPVVLYVDYDTFMRCVEGDLKMSGKRVDERFFILPNRGDFGIVVPGEYVTIGRYNRATVVIPTATPAAKKRSRRFT